MQLSRFQISNGQMRTNDFIHNGGWYTRTGEKIGWGDLNPADLERIKESLQEGEMFVILGESDSFWNFVSWNDKQGVVDPKEQNPGAKYLREKARFVIVPGKIYSLSRSDKGLTSYHHRSGTIQVECVGSWEGIL